MIVEVKASGKSKNQFYIFEFILELFSKEEFIGSILTEIPKHLIISELILDELILSNYLPYLNKDKLITAIFNLGNKPLKKLVRTNYLVVFLNIISQHSLNDETESQIEGIRNELYILFKSNDILLKDLFEKHLFEKINTKTK